MRINIPEIKLLTAILYKTLENDLFFVYNVLYKEYKITGEKL